jgi:hypothetical protein
MADENPNLSFLEVARRHQKGITAFGKLVSPAPRSLDSSFRVEMNLGCELPVCVANRSEVDNEAIEIEADNGAQWRLVRTAGSRLPSPEHYQYWLWVLDRWQAAFEQGEQDPPRIVLNPSEIFDLVGSPKGGNQYRYLDEAFTRFSRMVITAHSLFHDKDGNARFIGNGNFGTLCHYVSWRVRPEPGQRTMEFANGWIAPGPLLWGSIQAGYTKSIPLRPLKDLSYIGQRLYTYLSKHCQPDGTFSISVKKLMPKIPIRGDSRKIVSMLEKHHNDLAKVGFLKDVDFEGRGKDRIIRYHRRPALLKTKSTTVIDVPALKSGE